MPTKKLTPFEFMQSKQALVDRYITLQSEYDMFQRRCDEMNMKPTIARYNDYVEFMHKAVSQYSQLDNDQSKPMPIWTPTSKRMRERRRKSTRIEVESQ